MFVSVTSANAEYGVMTVIWKIITTVISNASNLFFIDVDLSLVLLGITYLFENNRLLLSPEKPVGYGVRIDPSCVSSCNISHWISLFTQNIRNDKIVAFERPNSHDM